MEDAEKWSWKKFFSGFIDGRNYAKSLVLMFCSIIIITICFCVYSVVKAKFIKKPTPVTQVETYGTINGGLVQTDSHDQKSKESKSYSLINLLCKN